MAFVAWSSNTEPTSASLMNLTMDVMTPLAEPESMVRLPFAHPRAGTLDVDQWPELYAAVSGAELIVLRCPQCRDVPRGCRCALGGISVRAISLHSKGRAVPLLWEARPQQAIQIRLR